VDSPIKAGQMIAAGVDGITTNKPGWLRDSVASTGFRSMKNAGSR
jgi:hypothetical protein